MTTFYCLAFWPKALRYTVATFLLMCSNLEPWNIGPDQLNTPFSCLKSQLEVYLTTAFKERPQNANYHLT